MIKNILVLLLYIPLSSSSQSLIIEVDEHHFIIDETNSIILSHIENIESFNNISSYNDIILSLNGVEFSYNTNPDSLSYSESYSVANLFKQFSLYFTPLPIISIESTNDIVNEPKTLASFVYSDNEQIITSNIGIELRGGSSQSYPKKTYDIEFWADDNGTDTKKVKFGDLRTDDDWILDGMYNEPLRLRSYIANNLWLDMHMPYYLENEPEAKAGADVKYVEVFINNIYNGIYNLSEQVDKKQLKLKSYNEDIRGELYKGITWGAPTFTRLPNFDNTLNTWSGYEVKYPKESDTINWQQLYSFTRFVVYSSDTEFTNNIWEEFNYDNYLDYFIFLNLLRATDNTGKNIYIAKYKADEPYFYIPWDLDGCFGIIWNGTNADITDDILNNSFHKRVIKLDPNDYSSVVKDKWAEYRNNILSTDSLIATFEHQYQFLLENKIYEREALVYPNYEFNEEDLDYLLTWLQKRLLFLDNYFGNSLKINSFENEKTYIYPNPTTSFIHLNGLKDIKNNKYKIYDLTGRIIQEGDINDNAISVENLNQGNYILVVNKHKYQLTVK